MVDVRYQYLVFFIHVLPIYPVHILGIEEITHLSPTLVVYLHPFLMVVDYFFHVFGRYRRTHPGGQDGNIQHLERGTGERNCLLVTGRKFHVSTQVGFTLATHVKVHGSTAPVVIYPVAEHMHVIIMIGGKHGQFDKAVVQVREIVNQCFFGLFIFDFCSRFYRNDIIFRGKRHRSVFCQRQHVHFIHVVVHVIPFRTAVRGRKGTCRHEHEVFAVVTEVG